MPHNDGLKQSTARVLNWVAFQYPDRRSLTIVIILAAVVILYILGGLQWAEFMNRGGLDLNAGDWTENGYRYLTILQHAWHEKQIPYFVANELQYTNRFLAIPQTLLSPQLVLLLIYEIPEFWFVNTILLYTVSFLGLMLVGRRLRLSLVAFTLLVILFNFNGYIVSHLTVGHTGWYGYFFFPYLGLFMLDLLDEKLDKNLPVKIAFVLFAIFLQGGFHLVVQLCLFLLFWVLLNARLLKTILLSFVFMALLSAFRLLPGLISFSDYSRDIYGGYLNLSNLLEGLVMIRGLSYVASSAQPLGWWEYDMYIDLLGLGLLLYFGIYRRITTTVNYRHSHQRPLDIAMLVFLILTFNRVIDFFAQIPFPFFNTQRVSSRFLIIPLFILLILAVKNLQKWLDQQNPGALLKTALVGGALVLHLSLQEHMRLWALRGLEQLRDPRSTSYSDIVLSQQYDALYVNMVNLSLLVSLCAIIGLGAYFVWNVIRASRAEPVT